MTAGSRRSMSGHSHPYRGLCDEWLTPPEILRALGAFDLDPCAPVDRPWDTAACHYTIQDDGLLRHWFGRVWCNPPYGPDTGKWLAKLASHGDGVALIFARTETEMFSTHVWPKAHGLLFLKGRLHFYRPDGTRAAANSGAPSVLIAYGESNMRCLESCQLEGKRIWLNHAAASRVNGRLFE